MVGEGPELTLLDVGLLELGQMEVAVAERVSSLFGNSKNPSLTLRVSLGFATLLAWSTRANREDRNIKTDASGFLWFATLLTWSTGRSEKGAASRLGRLLGRFSFRAASPSLGRARFLDGGAPGIARDQRYDLLSQGIDFHDQLVDSADEEQVGDQCGNRDAQTGGCRQ